MKKKIRYGSVCSGIEAASQAWKQLGWECAFVAEIEKFPSEVIKHHYPEYPNYGDITKFKEWPQQSIDVLVGGTPCQSFSVAGLRKGISDPRGNLALTFLAIADKYRPRWILWENVPGVHSSWSDAAVRPPTESEAELLRGRGLDPGEYEYAEQTNDFDGFLAGMEELGYGVATAILDAQYFGVAQRRERVFAVGHLGGKWQRSAAVLFDGACLRGDPAPSRKAGQRIAPTVEARANGGGGGWGTDFLSGGGLASSGDLAPCIDANIEAKNGCDQHVNAPPWVVHGVNDNPEVARSLTACETATGRLDPSEMTFVSHPPTIGFSSKDSGNDAANDLAPTLRGGNEVDGNANGGIAPAVAFHENQRGEITVNDTAGSLKNGGGKPGQGYPAARIGMSVRRLTPTECERLQGFSDNYTKISEKTADGPRYKALGNSFAVPVITWIGKRIQLVDSIPTPV